MSELNPFSATLSAQTKAYEKASAEKAKWLSKLSWYREFDVDASFASMHAARAEAQKAEDALADSAEKHKTQKMMTAALKEKSGLGFDPRYWFSTERATAKRRYEEASQALAKLERSRAELHKKRDASRERANSLQADLKQYQDFDSLLALDAIRCLNVLQDQLSSEIARLVEREREADLQLQIPLKELDQKKQQRYVLMQQMDRAERLDQDLSNAQTKTEKAKIHAQCREQLGEDSPRNILRTLQPKLAAIERDIQKLEDRIKTITMRLTWDVRTLIVDGNNLCYQQSKFIGLVALQALVSALIGQYQITIVFDSGIRGHLKMKNTDISARFDPSVKVHVVASSKKADETILRIAETDPTTFVISNDRFAEFTNMRAVKEERLLRHEIVNNTVYLNDLNLAIDFSHSQ